MIGNAFGLRAPKSFDEKVRNTLKNIEKEKAVKSFIEARRKNRRK